jgi:hypothetical protein
MTNKKEAKRRIKSYIKNKKNPLYIKTKKNNEIALIVKKDKIKAKDCRTGKNKTKKGVYIGLKFTKKF